VERQAGRGLVYNIARAPVVTNQKWSLHHVLTPIEYSRPSPPDHRGLHPFCFGTKQQVEEHVLPSLGDESAGGDKVNSR